MFSRIRVITSAGMLMRSSASAALSGAGPGLASTTGSALPLRRERREGGRLDPAESPPTHLTGLFTVDALLHGQWALLWSAIRHLVLPGLVLAIYTIGMLTRFTRASMLEIMGNDYVRAARLKGLPEHTVILRHVLRPALISVITVAGLAFANLLSGTVLVENIFAWPGIGQYAYHSAVSLDLPAIMGVSLFIALVYIAVNLVVDLLYGVIDPRIRLS